MSKELQLEVVTPDKVVLSEAVDYVGAPGMEGDFGVLPGHMPFLSTLGVGSLMYKKDGHTHYMFLSGGFAEVYNNKVTVLAEVAERPEDIDLERAKKALDRAQERLARHQEKTDYMRAQAALHRAVARISTMRADKQSN